VAACEAGWAGSVASHLLRQGATCGAARGGTGAGSQRASLPRNERKRLRSISGWKLDVSWLFKQKANRRRMRWEDLPQALQDASLKPVVKKY